MSPHERAQKKAKLLQRASDHRGNEHERLIAEQNYRKMCEADGAVTAAVAPRRKARRRPAARSEFNRVERAVIKLGAVVFLGSALIAEWLAARPTKTRRGAHRPRAKSA